MEGGGAPLTVLFTDVEASTELHLRLGDESAQAALRAHNDLVRALASEHGGREIKSLGDGLLLAFGSTRRALGCAVAVQRAVSDSGVAGPPLRLRIGVNTGEVLEQDDDVLGTTVNVASRIAQKAKGGEILVAEVVKHLAGAASDTSFRDRGRFRLKGLPDRMRLYEVVWREEVPAGRSITVTERTPFVAREEERAALLTMLEQAAAGHGGIALIGGEPGVGKTRLAEEIAASAAERGFRVRMGHCYEMEGAPPFIPFVEVLEAAIRDVEPEVLRRVLGDSAPEVARLVPELRRIFSDIDAPLELAPEQERRFLLNSVRDFLVRAARVRPQLLIVDDLQWADEPTLMLLEHVAERLPEMSLLVIGTYRDVELDTARPLAASLVTLQRRHHARRISLKRLDEAGTAALLRSLGAGQEAPPELVAAVRAETEGNPFFVEEVFRYLAESGRLLDAEGRFRSDIVIGELDVPESVRLVIGRRLERVSDETRGILRVAATTGRSFDYRILEAAGDLSPDALLDCIDEAERARLIVAAESAQTASFRFAHELIRQTLLSDLALPRRQRLHLRIADALESIGAGDTPEGIAGLAHHLYQAGTAAEGGRAARWLLLAGDRSREAAAFEDALRDFERALEVLPADARAERAAAWAGKGLAERSLSRHEAAVASWDAAMSLYEELGDVEALAELCTVASSQHNWAYEFQQSFAAAQRGLLVVSPDSPNRSRLLGMSGIALSLGGFHDQAAAQLEEALTLALRSGLRRVIGEAEYLNGVHHWAYLRVAEAEALFDSALRTMEPDQAWWRCSVGGFASNARVLLGHYAARRPESEEHIAVADRLGARRSAVLGRRSRSCQICTEAAPADYLRILEEQTALDREGTAPLPENFAVETTLYGAVNLYMHGEWERATAMSGEARNRLARGIWWGVGHAIHATLCAWTGNLDGARATLNEVDDSLPLVGQPTVAARWNLAQSAAEIALFAGDAVLAERVLPSLEEMAGRGVVYRYYDLRQYTTAAGCAAAALGQMDIARRHFQRAEETARSLGGHPAEMAHLRFYQGLAALRNSEPDAHDHLRDSERRFAEMGMQRHAAKARDISRGASS